MDVEQFKEDVREGRIDADRLIELVVTLQHALQDVTGELNQASEDLKQAKKRIEELERKLGGSGMVKFDEAFSLRAEEERQKKRGKKPRDSKSTERRGRTTTAEKVALAARTEKVFPAGVPEEDCTFSHMRTIWRFENNQAILIAYEIYCKNNQYGKVPGAMGRSDFAMEIVVAIAFQVFVVGLSFDKVCMLLGFFQNLMIRKSQVDALLNQLAKHWEHEFDLLCVLLANSAVVHADETSWSIHSVWAFLSEKVRVLFFGVHKDGATLKEILDPESFAGIVISDDAAVYANFTQSQKCWAHLLRKAIKLTLLEPDNTDYRAFTDRLLEIYRAACRIQRDQRFGDAGRARKVAELDEEIRELCGPIWFAELPPLEGPADDFRLLCNELMRLMLAEQLFTFVTASAVHTPSGETEPVAGTNNEAERSLRHPAMARNTGCTSKTLRGARRRTIIESVLESLRRYLPAFTLSGIIHEISRWSTAGQSCFADLLDKLNLPFPTTSPLDALFPDPIAQPP